MKYTILILMFLGIQSCRNNNVNQSKKAPIIDSGLLKVSEKQSDEPINDDLKAQLRPIQDNFKRINSIPIHDWSLVFNEDLEGEGEGSVASFYFYSNRLEKMIVTAYGETGQSLTEYYLMNGQLSFVFSKDATYNRPVYYDSAKMLENNDTVVFDPKKSDIMEDRYYFKNNKLIHEVNNQDCGAPNAPEFVLEEQNRLLKEFDELLKLSKNPR